VTEALSRVAALDDFIASRIACSRQPRPSTEVAKSAVSYMVVGAFLISAADGAVVTLVTAGVEHALSCLSNQEAADMIKRRAASCRSRWCVAEHSLTSGFATEDYAQGTSELAIMCYGGQRSQA
jgi:hypothetical protein